MSAPFVSDAEIEAIGEGMIRRSLPKAQWTHVAHFAAAAWILRRRPDLIAERDMPGLIRAYNQSVGGVNSDTEGYHQTITQASLRAVRAGLAEAGEAALFEDVNALLASALGRSDWLLDYWSHEMLFSVQARRVWVEPDLRPLPF